MAEKQYKVFTLLDDIAESYKEPVMIQDGLNHNLKDTIRTIEFYSNNQYLSGNKDALGREKPFYNIGNYRVQIAKVQTDLDVKDIKFEPDSLKHSAQAMIYNKELYKYLKDANFSKYLNESGHTRPKYGGVITKKYDDGEGMEIEVVPWTNIDVDPSSINDSPIIETHYMSTVDLADKADVWKDYDSVEDVLKAHTKANKNKPAKIEVKELTGEFLESYDPTNENEPPKDEWKYKKMCFYIACVNKKKFLLHKEDLKEDDDKYKYLAWSEVPKRGLGVGVVEEGFEAQVWTNDSIISMKNAMELSGKVILHTDSQKVSGNVLTGIDNGQILSLEQGRSITSLNLSATSLPEFHNQIELWKQQYNSSASTYDANTGEAPTAGTPYSQTALLNQVANSPFEYRREEWGIHLNEILNDWVLPYLKKKILKEHTLVADYDDEELAFIDDSISNYNANMAVKDAVLRGEAPDMSQYTQIKEAYKELLGKDGKKREMLIPDGFLDVEGKLTANITGELKNKQAILQSLDSVFKTVASTFNPNTGTYGALEDPALSKIFKSIMSVAGVEIAFPKAGQAPAQPTAQPSPMQPQDLSAVASQQPIA